MEKLTIEIPAESVIIRSAMCPNGHDLVDPDYIMAEEPSIRVTVRGPQTSGILHFHPAYGNHMVETDLNLREGEAYEMLCPDCGISLLHRDECCVFCSAPLFVVYLPKGGQIKGCTRKGCHNHRLELVDIESQLACLFSDELKPRF